MIRSHDNTIFDELDEIYTLHMKQRILIDRICPLLDAAEQAIDQLNAACNPQSIDVRNLLLSLRDMSNEIRYTDTRNRHTRAG